MQNITHKYTDNIYIYISLHVCSFTMIHTYIESFTLTMLAAETLRLPSASRIQVVGPRRFSDEDGNATWARLWYPYGKSMGNL